MGITENWTWKAWLFITAVIVLGSLLAGLSQMIREGAFGDDAAWLADWIVPVFGIACIVLIIVFRKKMAEWERRP